MVRRKAESAVRGKSLCLLGFPLHEAGENHPYRDGQNDGQDGEYYRPDEDCEERFLDTFVLEHAGEVIPADAGHRIAWAQLSLPQLPSALTAW